MILPITTPIHSFYRPSFKRTRNEIPEELRLYKEKTGDFAFCQIDGLTCPACGSPMLSQKTFDQISTRISSASPQECMEILYENKKYMVPAKINIFEKVVKHQAKEPEKSIVQVLEDIDAKDNEQMIEAQMKILGVMADIAKAAGDKKIVEQQKKMFLSLKECRSGLSEQEKSIFDDILFVYEDRLKTKKRPIPTTKLISRIKSTEFENEKFTRLVISRINKVKGCPEYEVLDVILSALGHLSDIKESRRIQRTNKIIVQEMKELLLSKEREKLEEIRAVASSLPEPEAKDVNRILDKACEKIDTQQSTIGRKPLLNQLRELNISSPEIMARITTIANSKIEDKGNYRSYILPPQYKQGADNASYSFSRENLIDKIRTSKLDDEKLKNQLLSIAKKLPSSNSEEKYNETRNLLDYSKKCKEPEVSRLIASAFLFGSVANTDHFEAVKGENKGLDIITNYLGMHTDCNSKKRHKSPEVWFQEDPKRPMYIRKYLNEVQQYINSGEIKDSRYTNYTNQIIDTVYTSTNGNVDLRSLAEA